MHAKRRERERERERAREREREREGGEEGEGEREEERDRGSIIETLTQHSFAFAAACSSLQVLKDQNEVTFAHCAFSDLFS